MDELNFAPFESFTCHIYEKKIHKGQDLPGMTFYMYNIYCRKAGKISSDALPSCWNTLKQHENV